MMIKDNQKVAIYTHDKSISYRELLNQIGSYLAILKDDKPSKVALFLENRPEWCAIFYASWCANAISVPIDCMSKSSELSYMLNDCRPEILFCSNATNTIAFQARNELGHSIKIINIDECKLPIPELITGFMPADLNKVAQIIYTSGTTGGPKGVMLTFKNILTNIESLQDTQIFRPEDRTFALLPYHHTFPLMGSMIIPLMTAGAIVFPKSLNPEDLMSALMTQQVTLIIAVPRFYNLIHKGIMKKINSSLIAKLLLKLCRVSGSQALAKIIFKAAHQKLGKNRYMVCGGAAIDIQIAKDFQTLGFQMLEGYGMTETSPMITFTRPGEVKPSCPGRLIKGTEVKIQDDEILCRGDNVMLGYFNRPKETADVIKDGWLHTGDLGYFDQEGYLHITGRKKDIIVLPNGKNVNPEEIEFKLSAMTDLISEVGVFYYQNVLYAAVVPNLVIVSQKGILNLESFLQTEIINKYNSEVSDYKRIAKFIMTKNELPRTRLGKIRRFMLTDLLVQPSQKKETKSDLSEEYLILRDFLQDHCEKNINPSDHFEIDLGMDSLDKITLLEFVTNTFGVKTNDRTLIENDTVEKLAILVENEKTQISEKAINWSEVLRSGQKFKIPRIGFEFSFLKMAITVFMRFFFRLKIRGVRYIPSRPCLIIPNHQSFLDGLVLISTLKTRFLKDSYFFAKTKHFRSSFAKLIASRNNIVLVDINQNVKESIQKISQLLASGKSVILFPEGTRSKDGTLAKFKETFAIIAKEINVPIAPITLKKLNYILPPGKMIPRPFKQIEIHFHELIMPDSASVSELVNKTKTAIKSSL